MHVGAHYFRGLRVLVVEDVVMNQELAREILESKGIAVSLANNGEEGVTAVAQGDFDLVLMDMQMPVMDGCQASEGIRRFNRKLPIIAMTANAMAADRNKCLAAGMNDYVTKPINTDELFTVMARWVKPAQSPPSPPVQGQPTAPQPATPEPATPEPTAQQPTLTRSPTQSYPASISATAVPSVTAGPGTPAAVLPPGASADATPRAAPARGASSQPAALPASLPGLAIAEGLKRCVGNTGLYLRFLSDFRRDQSTSGESFRAFIEAGDMASVKALGHKLKGLAGNLAAREVSAAAAALEKAPSAAEATLALTVFEAELQTFLSSIGQLLPKPPESPSRLSATASSAAETPKAALATPSSNPRAAVLEIPSSALEAAANSISPPGIPQPAAPEPAAPEPAAPLFARDELASRLDALTPLIRARKISAFDVAQEYQSQWPLAEQSALLGELCTALDAFDFAQAERLLETLRQGVDAAART